MQNFIVHGQASAFDEMSMHDLTCSAAGAMPRRRRTHRTGTPSLRWSERRKHLNMCLVPSHKRTGMAIKRQKQQTWLERIA